MVAPPSWLATFADQVAAQIHPIDVLAPLGCHYHLDEEVWEVTLFVSKTEVIGGPKDGRLKNSRFQLDIKGVLETFDAVESCAWQPMGLGEEDEVGPHLSIEGIYAGHPIWLRLPATAPQQFDPGRYAVVHERRWKEVW